MERVEVINTETGENTVFPCNKWLSKSKEDGEIARDLYPLMEEREMRRKEASSRSPQRRGGGNTFYDDEPMPSNSKQRRGGYRDEEIDAFERNSGRHDRWRNEY